ncbi:MAG: family 10 glycosylhydrolase, partial [Planctomycetota bacterium]
MTGPLSKTSREFAAARSAGLATIAAALLLAIVVAVVSSCRSSPPVRRQPPSPFRADPSSPATPAQGKSGVSWKPGDASRMVLPALPREFRAVWVASVANIDWPSKPGLPTSTQRAEMIAMLDKLAALKFNAVILQVRPCCDALYPSAIEPWSEFLTGKSGQAPSPLWDPLAEWIAQAHARGIELHAWINPFRARHFEEKGQAASSHISRTRPDLVRPYDQFLWLDPGESDAQDHSMSVVRDIVSRYDIDGLHIDDYFYPYPKGNEQFPDEHAWQQYRKSGGSLGRDDWRRSNIDAFVERMSREAHAAKPTLRVGISPFGIWRPDHPPGVKGLDAHARLYADARKWLTSGWLDYCSPQLYWRLDAKEQPYEPLLKWWLSQNPRGRAIWPGNYASKVLPSKDPKVTPWPADEIVRQIGVTRSSGAGGNIQFSARTIVQNVGGIADALSKGPYADWSLPPAMPWLSTPAAPPTVLV